MTTPRQGIVLMSDELLDKLRECESLRLNEKDEAGNTGEMSTLVVEIRQAIKWRELELKQREKSKETQWTTTEPQ